MSTFQQYSINSQTTVKIYAYHHDFNKNIKLTSLNLDHY